MLYVLATFSPALLKFFTSDFQLRMVHCLRGDDGRPGNNEAVLLDMGECASS
jgi:hypothetical protein